MRAMVWNGVVSLLFLPLGKISGKGVCFTNWKIGFVGIMEYGGFPRGLAIWRFGGLEGPFNKWKKKPRGGIKEALRYSNKRIQVYQGLQG